MDKEKKQCPHCSTWFEPYNTSQKYCNKYCMRKHYYDTVAKHKKHGPYPRNLTCKECGKPFKSKTKRIYCSAECRKNRILEPKGKPEPTGQIDKKWLVRGLPSMKTGLGALD